MGTSSPSYFFTETQSVDKRFGDTFGFIWASYAGLRDLWWQVRGFSTQFPGLHINEVRAKFFSGLPLPGGVDLQRVCLKTEWSEHEEEFAKWVLFESCTLYENWAEKVCARLFPSGDAAERHAKSLQFPTGTTRAGRPRGYRLAVNAANASVSQLILKEFFPKLIASKFNRWSTIEDHLLAFRYFKECRNSIIHSDGVVSQDLLDLRSELMSAQANTPAPFRHPFSLPSATLDAPIVLHLKDCILFSTIVRFLICTFDAALCVSVNSEALLIERVRSFKSKNSALKNFPHDPAKRSQRFRRLLSAARIPEPVNLQNLEAWFRSKHVI